MISLKTIRKIFTLIFIVILVFVIGAFILVKSIAVDVTDSDLPQDVYSDDGDLLTISQLKILGLVLANEQERYNIIEEFMNYIILDSIQTNINSAYDPLGDIDTNEANYVIYDSGLYIDYVYAELNDSNQIVICVSFGSDRYLTMHSAIYLIFDIDVQIELLNISVVLTLSEYSIADKNLSFKILDYLFTKLDKNKIEESITLGILDLDEYTFTISLIG